MKKDIPTPTPEETDEVNASKVVHTDTFSDETITYGSLREQAGHAAWGLQKRLGLQPGDTLLALVNNSNAFVLLAHATWWTGAIFVPLNTSATRDDISHVLKLVQPTHVATIEEKLSVVQDALASQSMTNTKILTVNFKEGNLPQFPNDIIGKRATETISPHGLQGKNGKDVVSTICFSSGTTGKMKGVQLSHYNLVMNSITMRASMPIRVNSAVREVFFAPYCHIYGLSLVVLAGMWVGAQYCGLPGFDLETFCRKSSELEVTDLHIVPPVALLLATSPVAQKVWSHRMFGGIIHQIDEDERAFGCVGKLFAGVEARLVDPKTNKDVPIGEEGELWVRGPVVMMGYVSDREATSQTFSEGWIRTGDILKIDENQNFWVTDRLKEMIKYKGFQIAPSELEDMLLRHPDVIDAAVCAVYDDSQATEVPLAYVSLSPATVGLLGSEKQKALDAIRIWMDSQLAGYKKLRGGVHHLQELPKTPTGKILRRLLPAKLNEQREAKL
ncbi:amp dependent CoA ligase [Penicillium waksmanii]|uniref:amp dependent CoA ligase n=1 Tax=Penicillium waksmanii TaxID=69791 RepID=UPI0025483119|nr:amp dependent CoA ligase [Penicillium waksmanii]KAJ5974292.1 amp dependent CoA ligase [Penicillium waksmanii]